MISESWTDKLFQEQNFDIVDQVRMLGIGIEIFDNFIRDNNLYNDKFKTWYYEILNKAQKQIALLDNSKYNYKQFRSRET